MSFFKLHTNKIKEMVNGGKRTKKGFATDLILYRLFSRVEFKFVKYFDLFNLVYFDKLKQNE
jgi:hypothetical protein